MTLITDESKMLRVLSEVYSDCLNAHDLQRLADVMPAEYLVRSLLGRVGEEPLPRGVKDKPTGKALTLLRFLRAWEQCPNESLGEFIESAQWQVKQVKRDPELLLSALPDDVIVQAAEQYAAPPPEPPQDP